jgi:hypothetical protein
MAFGALAGWSSPPIAAMPALSAEATSWSLIAGVFGLVIGVLLPRPRILESGARAGALLWTTPPGTALRRIALLFHGAVILRDVWQHSIAAGLHAYLLAIWGWLAGGGWVLASDQAGKAKSAPEAPVTLAQQQPSGSRKQQIQQHIPSQSTDGWYVTEADLEFFKQHVEQNVQLEGATKWESQMDKDFKTFNYSAWRRILPNGKAEYKSVTVSLDATAEEFTDFYLDDDVRPTWDGMITHHDVLEVGSPADRCQVVHWIRSFPFAFIGDREYVIARRQFRDANGCIYVMTKSVEHPRVPEDDSAVRMDVFYSMWRSRTVPCPRGSGRPACETVLLHHEQFKIPENLARFAVKAGMGGFVKKMGPAVVAFVSSRRQHTDPFKADPNAYGVKRIARTASNASSLDTVGTEYTDGDGSVAAEDSRYPQRVARPRRRRKPKAGGVRRLVALSLGVATVAVALQRGRGLQSLLGAVAGLRPRRQRQIAAAPSA